MNGRLVTGVLGCAAVMLAAGCAREKMDGFLGSAVVESRTYQVAGLVQGTVREVYRSEGARVTADELVAIIDTVPIVLRIAELNANGAELELTIAAKGAEKASLEAEIRGLAREFGRIGDLADKGAVPSKQKDDLGTKVQAANQQLKAAQFMLKSLEEKKQTLAVNREQLLDQLAKCYLHAPASGIVISRYKNSGEVVGPAMPILEIAAFDTMYADFFVPQPLLSSLTYGQEVRIRVDAQDGAANALFLPARISWISDEAEFSPKNIQTRESRNELVFKVRADAANKDGVLKRGLPVEIWLARG